MKLGDMWFTITGNSEGVRAVLMLPRPNDNEEAKEWRSIEPVHQQVLEVLRPFSFDVETVENYAMLGRSATIVTLPRMQDANWEYILLNMGDMTLWAFKLLWSIKIGQNAELQGRQAMLFLVQLYQRFTGEMHITSRVHLAWNDWEDAPADARVAFRNGTLRLRCSHLTGQLIGRGGENIRQIREAFEPLGIRVEVDAPLQKRPKLVLGENQRYQPLVPSGRITPRERSLARELWEAGSRARVAEVDPSMGGQARVEMKNELLGLPLASGWWKSPNLRGLVMQHIEAASLRADGHNPDHVLDMLIELSLRPEPAHSS